MASKRNIRKPGVSRNIPKNTGGGGFFRLLISTPVRQLLMTAVIVVLLAVFWNDIKNGLDYLVDLFGVGLAFIVAVIVILIVLIWKRALSTLLFRWYRWLGGRFRPGDMGDSGFFTGTRCFYFRSGWTIRA